MSRRDSHRDRERHRERDVREPDIKRRRSGFDQPPTSLDGDVERPMKEVESVALNDERPRRGFHDALPPPPPYSGSMPEPERVEGPRGKEEEKKEAANGRGNKEARRNEDPARSPRSRTYLQHDEHGNSGQVGRSFGRRAFSDRQWRDSKDDRSDKRSNYYTPNNLKRKDEKYQSKRDGHSAWRHDGYFRMEAEQPPLPRKRPAFREQKMPLDADNADRTVVEPARSIHLDRSAPTGKEREERDVNEPRPADKSENLTVWGRRDAHRTGFSSRDRYNSGSGNYRGRERFDGKQGYRANGTQVDKWKHDLFDEANKSPTLVNEEDKIAKLEQLLAS